MARQTDSGISGANERAGGGLAPDHKRLLGINDGKVEGYELPDPDMILAVDVQYDYWTPGLYNLLTAARWKTNLSDGWFVPAIFPNLATRGRTTTRL